VATRSVSTFSIYLTFASPGEFSSRNIFTDEQPLRRARGSKTLRTSAE
jgi:hypothetical protein